MKYWAIADYLKEKGKGLESKTLHEGTLYKRINWDYGQMIGKETKFVKPSTGQQLAK